MRHDYIIELSMREMIQEQEKVQKMHLNFDARIYIGGTSIMSRPDIGICF